ncbi:MAG TPA: class I SAM-dependent rRNA methyltransferase [Chthoniobacteraceae bacterium]|jgi:23S rRNA (cytosine1962-C5)-methyltransferase|nr:class I SAM-dependent rRNA methyltransferase [Chthoniobacteraceae bacterium]
MAGLVIKPRSRIFHGHDWVYSSEVLKAFGGPANGSVVSLKDGADRLLGSAIYNAKSQIVARRFSRQRQELDLDFFVRRLRLALEYRQKHGLARNVGRLVWSESDGLPGVIVDRYGEHLVLQTLTLAMDQRKDLLVTALKDICQPRSIIERNDAPIRKAEGLELQTGVLHGDAPAPFDLEISGLRYVIDLLHGQKTGFYLDQIPNYEIVAQHARGRRVLDCFANQGAFALSCARAGASQVTAIEISPEWVGLIKENAQRNGLAIEARAANVFDLFKDLERQEARYDLIVLDPPSFTKTKGKLNEALRGYKEIHLRSLKLLEAEGLLATFCCSHHVTRELFFDVINEAAVDAKKTLRLLGSFSQALDHPVITTIPETEYLKGYLLELVPGR